MPETPDASLVHSLTREPTVHFLAVAILVFALYALNNAGAGQVLEIDPGEIEARVLLREINTGEPVTEAQRQAIVDAYIEEQILVREALAMELDNDTRIHDLLAQKMRHVLSGDIIQPSDSELAAFYAANRDSYRVPSTLSAAEVVFDQGDDLPPEVIALLEAGAEPEAMLALAAGDSGPLRNANRLDLANIFSAEFADRVFAAAPGQWQGPFVSNRGQHWLRVTAREEARVAALEEISDRVRLDWIAVEEENRLAEEIARLRQDYTVVMRESEAE